MAEEKNAQATAEEQEASQAEETATTETDSRFEALLQQIDQMTVRDLVDLVASIEKRYNVSASAAVAAVAMPAAAGAAGDGAAAEGGASTVTVTLKSAGQSKIQVIKKVKEITGLGLKESKELVDKAPSPVKEGISPDEAENIKAQLEEVGAEVEIS